MPSLSLKNKPQSPDGDTLVIGHMKKKKKGGKTMSDSRIRDYSQLSSELTNDDAMDALRESKVRMGLLSKTEELQDQLLRSRLTLISVPEKLKEVSSDDISVNRLSQMFHKVLKKQDLHMASQDA